MNDNTRPELEAVVTSVTGRKGNEYVVTRLTPSSARPSGMSDQATVTFSLSVWKGEHMPENGQLVRLGDIEKFARGWRARIAKPIQA